MTSPRGTESKERGRTTAGVTVYDEIDKVESTSSNTFEDATYDCGDTS